MTSPVLALIWAQSRNGVIGRDGGLPWRLPDEMAHFKRTTMGKPVIMGRHTWTGRLLPGRTNIVVTRSGIADAPSALVVVPTLDEAIAHARACAQRDGADEYFGIGGRGIYAACWPMAQRLYATFVAADVDGDVRFPDVDWSPFALTQRSEHAADARHAFAFSVCTFERR